MSLATVAYPMLLSTADDELPQVADIAPAAPPIDEADIETFEATRSACGICEQPLDRRRNAHGILSCNHAVHATCFVACANACRRASSQSLDLPAMMTGGRGYCVHCRSASGSAGSQGETSTDPELSRDHCYQKMLHKHWRAYPTSRDSFEMNDLPVALLWKIIGSKSSSSSMTGLARSLRTLIPSSRPLEYRERIEARRRDVDITSRARFVELLVESGRTLDEILLETDVNIAQLYAAGVTDMDLLFKIGFSPARHLQPEHRERLPVFFLSSYMQLDYATHIKPTRMDALSLAQLSLTKEELRLLGIDASVLVQAGLNSRSFRKFGLSFLRGWRHFMGLEISHVISAHISATDITRLKKWNRDVQSNDTLAFMGNAFGIETLKAIV